MKSPVPIATPAMWDNTRAPWLGFAFFVPWAHIRIHWPRRLAQLVLLGAIKVILGGLCVLLALLAPLPLQQAKACVLIVLWERTNQEPVKPHVCLVQPMQSVRPLDPVDLQAMLGMPNVVAPVQLALQVNTVPQQAQRHVPTARLAVTVA